MIFAGFPRLSARFLQVVRPGLAWLGLAWLGLGGLAWLGSARLGSAWLGLARLGRLGAVHFLVALPPWSCALPACEFAWDFAGYFANFLGLGSALGAWRLALGGSARLGSARLGSARCVASFRPRFASFRPRFALVSPRFVSFRLVSLSFRLVSPILRFRP